MANKARLDNRWGCSVGRAFRNFNPPSRLDAPSRPSGASAWTLVVGMLVGRFWERRLGVRGDCSKEHFFLDAVLGGGIIDP